MTSEVRRYVVVGNGVAGTTAAETIRKHDPNGRVTLITDEPYPLYNRVALPRFLRGDIDQRRVMMRDVEAHQRKGIDLRLGTRVTRVNLQERTVLLQDGQEMAFDRLLLATGGRPRRLQVPGADARGIHYFQTLDDARRLREHARGARRAVTVGGSYIAYELTEGLRSLGLEVTWLIRGPRFLHRVLDEQGGLLVDDIARRHGVNVVYGEEVARVQVRDGVVTGVETTGGRHIDCDIVACGLGLILNVEFLQDSGIEMGRGILTDARLETNVPGVFAAGDVAEFFDTFIQRHNVMGTWNNAQGHGRVAGVNMTGGDRRYTDVPHYTTTLFDSTMTAIGMTTEVDPNLESVVLCDRKAGSYRRLFFDAEDRLVGAVLIGDLTPRREIAQMITARQRVTDRQQVLERLK